ncbi:MAG TPA: MFS transporter [Candidatus Doudnabacteria bacterium]|nr:MFS transporter [Candidatus Doudnabacteria bacterium]
MLSHYHLPHYFATKVRKEIEHLYASTAIGNLAQAMITLFEPIFLYQVVGLSVTEVLLFMAVVYAVYVVFIPLGAKIASRHGYAHAILYSIPFQILFWLSLVGAQYSEWFLYAAPIFFAIQKTLFWPAWHATLARYADGRQVGREFSFMYAIMSLMQILGPMMGGFLALFLGSSSIFVIGSIIYVCSAIPLMWTAEVFTPKEYKFADTWKIYKQYPARFAGYFGFGEELIVLTIWPIFIFFLLKNYQDIGSLVTVATLVGTGLALLIGLYSDGHSKRNFLRLGNYFYVLSWLARIPAVSVFGAFFADGFSRTAKSMVFIPMSALTYERAESTQIMPYVVGFEQALSMGKFLGAVLGAIVFALTGSFVALFILGAIFTLFYFLI